MTTQLIPMQSIFVEQQGWAYYVANWQPRFTTPLRAMLVKLSPRHFARYMALKRKGRGEKTIAYLLFKRIPVLVVDNDKPVSKAPSAEGKKPIMTVEIHNMTKEQLVLLIRRSFSGRFPDLYKLSVTELRNTYLSMQAQKVAALARQASESKMIKSGIEHY